MGYVLINAYWKCKLAYLYTVASMMFLAPVFNLIQVISLNWYRGCKYFYQVNPKCPGNEEPSKEWISNILTLNKVSFALSCCFYYVGHWLFAFRYFEVAEMFGRKDKSLKKHEEVRKVTKKISYIGVGVIVLNYLLFIANHAIYYRINNGHDNVMLFEFTTKYIPNTFLIVYCTLLLIALVWICHSLRYDPHMMGNEKWMAAHSILLMFILVAYIYNANSLNFVSKEVVIALNTIVYFLMAFIMDQVNYP
jgi:hypothetical protein